jgi:hypothetical protein
MKLADLLLAWCPLCAKCGLMQRSKQRRYSITSSGTTKERCSTHCNELSFARSLVNFAERKNNGHIRNPHNTMSPRSYSPAPVMRRLPLRKVK